MARLLAQTLGREQQQQTLTLIRSFSPSILNHSRSKSDRPGPGRGKGELIEIDLGSETESDKGGEEIEIHFGVKRLEDAIHSIIVRRSAPDWLPFVPGSSYWVPPKIQLLGGKSPLPSTSPNPDSSSPSSIFESVTVREESPSFSYFVGGASSHIVALPRHVKRRSKKAGTRSDDEE